MILKIIISLVAVVALLAATIFVIGKNLPLRHRAGTWIDLRAAPEAVYDRIVAVDHAREWRSEVKSVDLLPEENGEAGFRIVDGNGAITYRIEQADRPRRFVTRIADTDLGFGGRWAIDIEPRAAGSRVRIVEEGEVTSPVFRFFSRYVFGHYRTQESYLRGLAASFGEAATIERMPD